MKKCWERINFELERLKYVLFLNKHQYKNNCNERQNKKKTELRSKFRTKNTDSEWKIHTFIKTDVGVIKKGESDWIEVKVGKINKKKVTRNKE